MKSKRDREEPCCICNHYHDLENGEQCQVCGHIMTVAERKQQDTVLPTAIIPGCLYLGSYDTASRSEILKAMGISHILNTVHNNPALFKNTFQYHTASSNPVDFNECFQFIDDAIKGEHKVLVYCMTGVSRSPAVVVAYLMKHRGWRLAESYKWVKDKRASINIKPEDEQRIRDFEVQLHGSSSAPMGLKALDSGASFPASARSLAQPQQQQQQHAASASGAPLFGGGQGDQPQWSLVGAQTAAGQPFSFGAGPPAQQQQQGPAPHFVFGGGPAPAAGQAANVANNDMEM